MNNKEYDIIIIGGGATGSGIALEVATRGFKTLLLEKNDFSEGTSSRSTKLVHGGVRYLEAAVKKLDIDQFNLVKEGLKERSRLLKNAPHLCSRLTLVTPIYKWWELPYMFMGLSVYDFISGKRGLGRSSIVCKKTMLKNFPNIKKDGLVGGVKYYDGSFNDARLNISILQTAVKNGAECKNHHEVNGFLYKEDKISGVKIKDTIANKEFEAYAPIVINATGAFSDKVRVLDEKKAKQMLHISSGIHIVLDKKFLPSNEGLMIPKTEDGRVLFILPWMGKCLVGTTDEPTIASEHPEVSDKDIEYILRHLKIYFDLVIEKREILSSWSGLRPLVAPEKGTDSASIVREHKIVKADSGLVSIIGGKWTTNRKIAEEVAEYITSRFDLKVTICKTKDLKLAGSENFTSEFKMDSVDEDICKHLHSMYGDKAQDVYKSVEKVEKLHSDYSYINAEVVYAVREEFTKKAIDYLVRRSTLALIDIKASKEILEKVLALMQEELNWNEKRVNFERTSTLAILDSAI